MSNVKSMTYRFAATGIPRGEKGEIPVIAWLSALPMGIFIAGLLIILLFTHRICLAGADDDQPKVLRSGFLARVIADVDPRDARATLELMTREVSRNMGLNTSSRVVLYTDTRSMIEAVHRGDLDMVSMPTIDYLRIRETVPLIPAFVGLHKESVGLRFVLITHRNCGINSISQLKGKSLLTLSKYKHEPAHLWLDVLLLKEGMGHGNNVFRQVKEVDKVSQGIMGVFFRKADAALVTRAGLDAARVLNPQLNKQLVVIAESGNLSDGVTCFPAGMSEKSRFLISSAILQMSNSITGKQLFTILQTSGVVPFKESYIEELEGLLMEESSPKGRLAKNK